MDFWAELIILGYIALAMLLGAVIGCERELADKPAGVRTHMSVAGAAALLVMLGDVLVEHFDQDSNVIRADPIRIIEAIVSGVAFLGAGMIIRDSSHNVVLGLTTGATLLLTAAVGICVAVKELTIAIGVTMLALLTLRTVHVVEVRLKRKVNST